MPAAVDAVGADRPRPGATGSPRAGPGDSGVEQRPREGRRSQAALRSRCQAVARWLLIRGALTIDLELVDHELAEQGRRAAPLEVDPDERVHVRVSVELFEQAEVHDVQIPRLEHAVPAGEDRSFP